MKNLLGVTLLCLFFAACDDGATPEKASNPAAALTPAQKLAIIDQVDPAGSDSQLIKDYLAHLAKTFNEPQDTIAEYTSRVEGVLKDKGVVTTNLEILRDMDGFKAQKGLDYHEAVTMYAMIRSK